MCLLLMSLGFKPFCAKKRKICWQYVSYKYRNPLNTFLRETQRAIGLRCLNRFEVEKNMCDDTDITALMENFPKLHVSILVLNPADYGKQRHYSYCKMCLSQCIHAHVRERERERERDALRNVHYMKKVLHYA